VLRSYFAALKRSVQASAVQLLWPLLPELLLHVVELVASMLHGYSTAETRLIAYQSNAVKYRPREAWTGRGVTRKPASKQGSCSSQSKWFVIQCV
jgi:hypothetical protein